MKVKHYNPMKLLIGLWAIFISLIKYFSARIFFPIPRKIDHSFKELNCILSINEFGENLNFKDTVKEILHLFKNAENPNSFVTV